MFLSILFFVDDVTIVEVGLIGLLRVLWRKFSENPATLDYFTFEDRRLPSSLIAIVIAICH